MSNGLGERSASWRVRPGWVVAVAVVAALASAGRAAAPAGPAGPTTRPVTLRVLTYNLHHGATAKDEPSLDRQAKVIRDADPDLVALQELDRTTARTGKVDQLAKLAELTGLHPAFGKSMDYDGGAYGNGVLSRRPIASADTHALPSSPGEEPRCVLVTTVRLGAEGPAVRFAATHLNHRNPDERVAQARKLAELLGPGPSKTRVDGLHEPAAEVGPTILAGDFNARPDSPPVEVLRQAGFRHAFAADPAADGAKPADGAKAIDEAKPAGEATPAPTSPAAKPRVTIDYVWVAPAGRWRVKEVKVLDEPEASDHRPVLVVLEWVGRP